MEVSADLYYPSATPEQAFAMVTNEDFRREVCRATHALHCDVSIARHPDGSANVVVARTMPAEVPDFAKMFVGETVHVVQSEQWAAAGADSSRGATLTLKIQGQPATMTATATTTAGPDGARTSIRGELKVSIPFVGKRIEPLIAEAIVAAIGKEQQIVDKWLGASP